TTWIYTHSLHDALPILPMKVIATVEIPRAGVTGVPTSTSGNYCEIAAALGAREKATKPATGASASFTARTRPKCESIRGRRPGEDRKSTRLTPVTVRSR